MGIGGATHHTAAGQQGALDLWRPEMKRCYAFVVHALKRLCVFLRSEIFNSEITVGYTLSP